MNRVNNHLYSMTRSAGIEDPLQPVVYQHSHWSVVDGISSLLPNKILSQTTGVENNCTEGEDRVTMNEGDPVAVDISTVSKSEADKMSTADKDDTVTMAKHRLPLANILNKEIKHSEDGVQSRFRIVKIESKGLFKRGRWTCRDFADPPEANASDVAETQSAGSSSTSEPVFYVQGAGPAVSQLIFYSEGHPVLESNALPCASKLFINEIASTISKTEPDPTSSSVHRPTTVSSDDRISDDSGLKLADDANCDVGSDGTSLADRHRSFHRMSLPGGQEEFSTPSLLSLAVDEGSELATASGSLSEIDNKIEQAMDLVKAHLMMAVRAEMEEFKQQIQQLMVKNHRLEYENSILRAAASPDLLASLDNATTDTEYNNGS